MPNANPNPYFYDGVFTDGSRTIINSTFEQTLFASTTVVQATNPTSATNLMTAVLNAGTFSAVGQSLEIFGAGIINLTTSTSTVTLAVIWGGVTLATFTTTAAAVAINLPWNLTVVATVQAFTPATGLAGGSVVLESHGSLSVALTTAAGAITGFNDTNTAVLSSITNSAPTTLQFQATIGTGNAASFVNQRQLTVELLN